MGFRSDMLTWVLQSTDDYIANSSISLNSYNPCTQYSFSIQSYGRLVPLRTQMGVISLNRQALMLMDIWSKVDVKQLHVLINT
jgi:hypothetical protein